MSMSTQHAQAELDVVTRQQNLSSQQSMHNVKSDLRCPALDICDISPSSAAREVKRQYLCAPALQAARVNNAYLLVCSERAGN